MMKPMTTNHQPPTTNGHAAPMLRLKDVCAQMNAGPNYVRKLISNGELRVYKPAADMRARYYQSDVDAILTGRGGTGKSK